MFAFFCVASIITTVAVVSGPWLFDIDAGPQ
jgi:hypothetical protein